MFAFDNSGATTDGVTDCDGNAGFIKDVWFAWNANATRTVTLETCGQTSVNTKVAVYHYLLCPPSPHIDCDNSTCSDQSRISWAATSGATYLIRIGVCCGFSGGAGTFTIAPDPDFGACCRPDGSCVLRTVDDCLGIGGTFQGDGSTCAGSVCIPLGSGFTYQGRLNLNGSPVNDTADFGFTLWDAAMGGNRIGGVAAIDNVMVADGLFTVEVNSSSEFGYDAFRPGAARWIGIAARSPHDPTGIAPFTTLTPRQLVTATPYSFYTRGLVVDDYLGNVTLSPLPNQGNTASLGFATVSGGSPTAPTTALRSEGGAGTAPPARGPRSEGE